MWQCKNDRKKIALNKVPGSDVVKAEFDNDDGKPAYDVVLVDSEFEYEIKVNAITGKIAEFEKESIYAKAK